jgi:hypothetical protein
VDSPFNSYHSDDSRGNRRRCRRRIPQEGRLDRRFHAGHDKPMDGSGHCTVSVPNNFLEKFVLISQTVSMSVIFYVVTYFLITWQWPETLLSIFVSTFLLDLFSGERGHSYEYSLLI